MPSKKYNGNSPLDGARLGGFADAELEIARRSPKQSMTAGLVQTPNGAIHAPKRRRRTSGGSSTGCIPWKPRLANTGTAESPTYEITLNAGTINGVINPNYSTGISVSTADIQNGTTLYILAVVNLTDNVTTSITYEVTSTLPDGDDLDPASKGALPSTMKVILGIWEGQTSCMVYNTPFSLVAYEAFREANPTPAIGQLPYFSWYKMRATKPS